MAWEKDEKEIKTLALACAQSLRRDTTSSGATNEDERISEGA